LVPLFPQFQVFDAPFLFKDLAAGFRVLDGPIGEEFFASLEPRGIVGLGWGTGGFRELETTSKPVAVPEDLKGLRIRIQGGAVYVAIFEALGSTPVTIELSELYTALSQHTVDGVDIPLVGVTPGKYYTILKHVAMSDHVLAVEPILGSKRKIDTLPPELQKILKEEGRAVVALVRSLTDRETANAHDILKNNGVTFTEIQYPAFRKAMDPVYAMFQAKLGGNLLDRVSRAANATPGRRR
jgi:TRAP-type transport system periplasmic protein